MLKSLLEKDAIRLSEKIFEKYQPKVEKYLRLSPAYEDRNALNALLEGDTLTSKAQEKLLWAFVALRSQKQTSITPQQLLEKAEVSASVLKKIVEKGILEVYTEAVDRGLFCLR